jgi:hypothetical protein
MSTEDELYGGETPLPDPEQRICDCTGRTAGQIEATLRRAGSRHPDTLRRHCGSGHQCGGCRPRIERIAATLSLPEVPPKPGLSWNRILRQTHLWASALACSLLLFFACTGFILNHRDAFGLDSVTRSDATLQLEISALAKPEADFLAVHLRRLGLRGEVSDCSIDDERITLRLESLGESHDVSIDRSSGRAEVASSRSTLLSALAELHRSERAVKSGSGSRFIDIAAILLAFTALSGLSLFFVLPAYRRRAWLLFAAATLLLTAIFLAWR